MPHPPIETLVEAALAVFAEEEAAGSREGEDALRALRERADRATLAAAIALTREDEPRRRRLGAAILGQLGHTAPDFTPVFVEARFEALAGALARERAGAGRADVLASLCFAFGHLGDARCVGLLADLADHGDEDVRYAVAVALSGHDAAAATLIGLSADAEACVRDWASFALARQTALDTPALRAALRARLDDPDDDAHDEAVVGLALRRDAGVRAALERALPSRRLSTLLFEAAAALADPTLSGPLRAARARADFPPQMDEDWRAGAIACGAIQRA